MSSPAQVAANRANALKSTGPRTVNGRTASSRNSRSHGLTSRDIVIVGEAEQAEFDELSQEILDEVQPRGVLQKLACQNLIHAAWNLHRCRRAEVAVMLREPERDPSLLRRGCDPLKNIELYARRAESAFYRAMKELRILQTEQQVRHQLGASGQAGPISYSSPLIDTTQLNRNLARIARETSAPPQRAGEKTNPIPAPPSPETAAQPAAPTGIAAQTRAA